MYGCRQEATPQPFLVFAAHRQVGSPAPGRSGVIHRFRDTPVEPGRRGSAFAETERGLVQHPGVFLGLQLDQLTEIKVCARTIRSLAALLDELASKQMPRNVL